MAVLLGMTSLGVCLVHSLITRGLGVIPGSAFVAPYRIVPVASEWGLAWGLSLGFATVTSKIPVLNRFVG